LLKLATRAARVGHRPEASAGARCFLTHSHWRCDRV